MSEKTEKDYKGIDKSVKVTKLTRRVLINQSTEQSPLLLPDNADRAERSKLCKKKLIVCFVAIVIIVILATIVAVTIYLYNSRIFLSTSQSGDTQLAHGDYALLNYHAQSTNIFYKTKLHFSVQDDKNKFPVNIYKLQCNMLPIYYASFDTKPIVTNFMNCSTICFFDGFTYEAKSNESIINYDIRVNDFVPEVMNVQVFAFDNLDYLTEHKSLLLPFKTVQMTTDRLQFTLNSTEIKHSSYYSFAIKCVNCSSNQFTINLTGVHAYYNGSNLTPFCVINTSTTNNCSIIITNDDYCFLGGIINESTGDDDDSAYQIQSIKYKTHTITTSTGYTIICIIMVVLILFPAVGVSLSCWISKQRRKYFSRVMSAISHDSAIVADAAQSSSYLCTPDHVEECSIDSEKYSDVSSESVEFEQSGSTITSKCIPSGQDLINCSGSFIPFSEQLTISSITTTSSDDDQHNSPVTSRQYDYIQESLPPTGDHNESNSHSISSQTDIEELIIHDKNQTSEESCEMADYCENSSLLQFDQFAQEFQTDNVGHIESVEFDGNGLCFHSHKYGATIVIPKGAVQGPSTLQLGVSLLLTNFKCDGSYQPVSPFIWVHTDAVLSKPAKLYIPHYINSNTVGDSKLVLLAKRHEKNAVFKVVADSELELFSTVACVSMKHFCVVCLANAMKNNPPERKYHVVCAEKSFKDGQKKEVHVCVLYTLQCLKNLKDYYEDKGFIMSAVKHLKASISSEGITVSSDLPPDGKWKVAKLGNYQKISCEDVDIYDFLDCTFRTVTQKHINDLKVYESSGSYPPRFILNFHNNSHNDDDDGCLSVTIGFNGLLSTTEFSHSTLLGETEKQATRVSTSSSDTVSSCTTGSIIVTHLRSSATDNDGFIFDIAPLLEGALMNTTNFLKFGHRLGISLDKLQEIEIAFGVNSSRCLTHILFQWKRDNPIGSYKDISEALFETGYPILSVIVNRQFSKNDQSRTDQDEFVIIEGPTIVKDYDKPRVSSISSLGLEIIQKNLTALPNGYKVLRSEPSAKDLESLVVDKIPAKWMAFGAEVHLTQDKLDEIELNHRKCRECFRDVLNTWKKQNFPPYTWETVLKVLYSPAIKGYKTGEDVYIHLLYAHSQLVSSITEY